MELGTGRRVKIAKLKGGLNYKFRSQETYLKLKESIKFFGNITPILIDQNNRIIDGYARVKIFRELNIDYINCSLVKFNKLTSQVFALNQAQISSSAKYDVKAVNDYFLTTDIPQQTFDLVGFRHEIITQMTNEDNTELIIDNPNQLTIDDIKPVKYRPVKEKDYSIT